MSGLNAMKDLACKTSLAERRMSKTSVVEEDLQTHGTYVRGVMADNDMPVVVSPVSPKGYPRRAAGAKACKILAKEYHERVVHRMKREEEGEMYCGGDW